MIQKYRDGNSHCQQDQEDNRQVFKLIPSKCHNFHKQIIRAPMIKIEKLRRLEAKLCIFSRGLTQYNGGQALVSVHLKPVIILWRFNKDRNEAFH